MNEQDQALIETICETIAIHIDRNIFDHLIAELIELGTIEANSAEEALDIYDKAIEGEDM